MSSSKNFLDPSLKSSIIVPTPPLTSPVITGTLSTAFYSPSTTVKMGDSVTYQIDITSSDSTGTFYAQGSDDNVSFADIGVCGIASAVNDVSVVQIDPADNFFYRVRYSPTVPGTGSCQIRVGYKPKGG